MTRVVCFFPFHLISIRHNIYKLNYVIGLDNVTNASQPLTNDGQYQCANA